MTLARLLCCPWEIRFHASVSRSPVFAAMLHAPSPPKAPFPAWRQATHHTHTRGVQTHCFRLLNGTSICKVTCPPAHRQPNAAPEHRGAQAAVPQAQSQKSLRGSWPPMKCRIQRGFNARERLRCTGAGPRLSRASTAHSLPLTAAQGKQASQARGEPSLVRAKANNHFGANTQPTPLLLLPLR